MTHAKRRCLRGLGGSSTEETCAETRAEAYALGCADILTQVFSFLPGPDLARVSRVDKYWQSLADPLWARVCRATWTSSSQPATWEILRLMGASAGQHIYKEFFKLRWLSQGPRAFVPAFPIGEYFFFFELYRWDGLVWSAIGTKKDLHQGGPEAVYARTRDKSIAVKIKQNQRVRGSLPKSFANRTSMRVRCTVLHPESRRSAFICNVPLNHFYITRMNFVDADDWEMIGVGKGDDIFPGLQHVVEGEAPVWEPNVYFAPVKKPDERPASERDGVPREYQVAGIMLLLNNFDIRVDDTEWRVALSTLNWRS